MSFIKFDKNEFSIKILFVIFFHSSKEIVIFKFHSFIQGNVLKKCGFEVLQIVFHSFNEGLTFLPHLKRFEEWSFKA
jgi:hypothetical protein